MKLIYFLLDKENKFHYHTNLISKKGKKMTEKVMKKRQYLHFRPDRRIERPDKSVETVVDSKGGATVCYLPYGGKIPKGCSLGISFCSPRDDFKNKVGREQSLRSARARKRDYGFFELLTWEEFVEEAEKMVQSAAENTIRIESDRIEKERRDFQKSEKESASLFLNISRIKLKIRQKV